MNTIKVDSVQQEAQCGSPVPPEEIPMWAQHDAKQWQRLDEFEILSKAEDATGLALEIKYFELPDEMWGMHIVHGAHGRICVNCALSPLWRRFAIFHELYHLLNNTKGARFWTCTYVSMDSIEHRADSFAWAAIWPEWSEGDYADWS